MPTYDEERREAVLVFYDAVLEGAKEPEDLVFFFIEHGLGEPRPDDWIFLGYLVQRDKTPASSDFTAMASEVALEKYASLKEMLELLFENLEGHPYTWWGHVDPEMIWERSSDRERDKRATAEHLLRGGMLTIVSAPDWVYPDYEWEVVTEAGVSGDSTEEEAQEYLDLFNTNLVEHIDMAGLLEDEEYPADGELPAGWDTGLLRLSDDWADLWFDYDFGDFVVENATHLVPDGEEDNK